MRFAHATSTAFAATVMQSHETADMALAVLDERYRESSRGKEPCEIAFLLSTVFVRRNGGWYFLYDQNARSSK